MGSSVLVRYGSLRRHLFREQAIVLAFDDRVTFASALLQTSSIQHSDAPVYVTDQVSML